MAAALDLHCVVVGVLTAWSALYETISRYFSKSHAPAALPNAACCTAYRCGAARRGAASAALAAMDAGAPSSKAQKTSQKDTPHRRDGFKPNAGKQRPPHGKARHLRGQAPAHDSTAAWRLRSSCTAD